MRKCCLVLSVIFLAGSVSSARGTEKKANAFQNAEYMQSTTTGQKKAAPAVKGTLSFDSATKSVDFLDRKGAQAFSIKYDTIKTLLYERTSKPRYAEAILISPLFILAHSKQHFLTIQYADASGTGQFVIVHLDKKNAREAVALAEAQTGRKVEQVEEK